MMNLLGNWRNREGLRRRQAREFAARVFLIGLTLIVGVFLIAAIVSCHEV